MALGDLGRGLLRPHPAVDEASHLGEVVGGLGGIPRVPGDDEGELEERDRSGNEAEGDAERRHARVYSEDVPV